MAITTLHGLYAVELVGQDPLLGGIQSATINLGSGTRGEPTSGSTYSHIQSLVSQSPTANWTTTALSAHFAKLSSIDKVVGQILVGNNPGLRLWQQKHAPGGTRANAANNHKSLLFKDGVTFPVSLTAPHQGVATLTYGAIAISPTGQASPITIGESKSLPSLDTLDEHRWTLGPVYIAGTRFDHLRGVEIDFGINAVAEGADSDIWPSFVSIRDVAPSITLQGIDVGWYSDAGGKIPAQGAPFELGDTKIQLRKLKKGGTYELNTDTVHIEFSATGIAVMQTVYDADGNNPNELTLQMALHGDLTKYPLSVNEATALLNP